jgi:hypothetical protein
MCAHWANNLLLIAACCLAGRLSIAQQTSIAPLEPLPPALRFVLPQTLLESVQIDSQLSHPSPVFHEHLTAQHFQPDPVYLLNSRFIINELGNINPQSIAKIDVYKGANAPAQWRSLTEHGIIDITLKHSTKLKLKAKSLAAIRRQVKASGVVRFQLDGLRIEDPSLRVAAAIAGLDVVRNDSETVINIRLAPPKPSPPRHDPPGTIYIRGVASQ